MSDRIYYVLPDGEALHPEGAVLLPVGSSVTLMTAPAMEGGEIVKYRIARIHAQLRDYGNRVVQITEVELETDKS